MTTEILIKKTPIWLNQIHRNPLLRRAVRNLKKSLNVIHLFGCVFVIIKYLRHFISLKGTRSAEKRADYVHKAT